MIVFLINPLVMPFAERFITGSGVYWRVFWLLQITFVTALGLCYICEIPKKKLLQTAILLFLSIAILISGRSIFKDEDVKEKYLTGKSGIAQLIDAEEVYLDSKFGWGAIPSFCS